MSISVTQEEAKWKPICIRLSSPSEVEFLQFVLKHFIETGNYEELVNQTRYVDYNNLNGLVKEFVNLKNNLNINLK